MAQVKSMTASRRATLGVSIPLIAVSLWLYARYAGVLGPNSTNFMPHGYCYMWDPRVVWLHVITDGLIALCYYAIPVILVYSIQKHRNLPFNWIFWMFAGFILACGTTHLMEVWNIWHGDYVLAGVIKAATAALSLLTAAMLIPLAPKGVALPALQALNRDLEEAIKDLSEQKFALDQHAIVATTDVQGTITYVNDKFCTISKYSREELIGQNHRLLNSGEHSKEFFRGMYRDIAGGGVWRGEICNRSKDGSLYWVDTTVIPFLDSHGKPRQYMAIRTDITERKRAEEALRLSYENERRLIKGAHSELERRVNERTLELAASNRILERSNIELQQFAYVASHDLQSPLRSISGFVQLLQMDYEEKLDDQGRDYIRRTVQGIAKMQTLIRDLLAYSHVDSRSRPFAAVRLVDVFHSSVSLLESSVRDAGGQVTCDELPVVLGDGSQLTQLMQNLIGNGLKYHGTEPPHVHVSAERGLKGNEWIVSVRDNGIGIDPKYFGRIFEIFKRLHNQKEYPGTGIGLAVCRRVVERHGGAIWVESEPGHGSNFRFSIPADTAQSTGKTETRVETNDQQSYQYETG
jgi:PAS domain S-box-containing protein